MKLTLSPATLQRLRAVLSAEDMTQLLDVLDAISRHVPMWCVRFVERILRAERDEKRKAQ